MQVLPDDFDPTATPGYLVARIARLLGRRNDELLAHHGVSAAWIPVLGALREGDALSQKELALRAEIGQPAMAQMLARMERDGVIVSAPDPDDGRARRYRLTRDARARVEPIVLAVRNANEEVFGRLSATKQKTLVSLLREVALALDEAPPVPPVEEEPPARGRARQPRRA